RRGGREPDERRGDRVCDRDRGDRGRADPRGAREGSAGPRDGLPAGAPRALRTLLPPRPRFREARRQARDHGSGHEVPAPQPEGHGVRDADDGESDGRARRGRTGQALLPAREAGTRVVTVGLPPVGLRGSFVVAAGLSDYLPILFMAVLAVAFAVASLGASALLRPHRPNRPKLSAYESGNDPVLLPGGERFSVKFYVVAMLFIIFDIETIFLFPWAVTFRQLG